MSWHGNGGNGGSNPGMELACVLGGSMVFDEIDEVDVVVVAAVTGVVVDGVDEGHIEVEEGGSKA